MAKLNKKEADKKYFERYKSSGRREENAKKKQERAEKRIAKLKARTEARKEKLKAIRKKRKEDRKNGIVPDNMQVIKTKDDIFEDMLALASNMESDYLSTYKRAKKLYRHNKILNQNLSEDGRDYGWWESKFRKLDDELKKEENELKQALGLKRNKGKMTIETRKEEKNYGRK